MKQIFVIIFLFFWFFSFAQKDTLETTQLSMDVKNNDWTTQVFCKIGDTIPFSGFMVNYYQNSKKIEWIVEYKNGQLATGLYRYYYLNGQMQETYFMDNIGYRFGKYSAWYDNGQIKETGEYNKDKKNGIWKKWDVAGNIISSIKYKDDKIIKLK